MAESAIYLYRFSFINKKMNYYFDEIGSYLTDAVTVYSNVEFQYQRIDRVMNIKIPVAQSNQLVYANYAKIIQDSRSFYFFINRIEWRGMDTLLLEIEMDVLNTFRLGTDYSFDMATHIRRQHKDRWVKGTHKMLPIIDRRSENLNPPIRTANITDIKDTSEWRYAKYGMLVAFAGTSADSMSSGVRAYLFAEKGHGVEKYVTEGSDTELTYFVPNSNNNQVLESPSTALVVDCPYKPFNDKSSEYGKGYPDDTYGYFSYVAWGASGVTDSYLSAINATTGNKYPYCDFNKQGALTPFFNSQLAEKSLPHLVADIPANFLTEYRDEDWEPKLQNMEFSYHRFTYGEDSYNIAYELIESLPNLNALNSDIFVKPTFFLAADLSGDMGFVFEMYSKTAGATPSYTNEGDLNPLRLMINRDNTKTVMSYAFTQYQNVDSQFDKKQLVLSRIATGVNIAGSVAGAAMGVASGNPALAVASVAQGTSSIAHGVLSRIQEEISYEKNIERSKVSAIGISGTSGIDSFNLLNGNLQPFQDSTLTHGAYLRFCYGEPRQEIKKAIYDYLYRYGYSENCYGIPNVNSRLRFNYLECDAVLRAQSVPVQYVEMLEEKYHQGVTFIHADMDWLFQYENWETSLL